MNESMLQDLLIGLTKSSSSSETCEQGSSTNHLLILSVNDKFWFTKRSRDKL